MKRSIKFLGILGLAVFGLQAQAQEKSDAESSMWDRDYENYRTPDQRGMNEFEPNKDTISPFDGINVRIGGAFALQFQGIDQENSGKTATPELQEIGDNFNLATANLDLDVKLYSGVKLHLRTYLSSQHHNEPYVKGGYLQVDRLDFIEEGFADDLMDHLRIKIGHMENNYGDAHFRRTDNAMGLYNPFVGNYLMDSFTTEVGAEVYYFNQGWFGMVGATNGKLNQDVTNPESTSPSLLGKVGYDSQIDKDLRFRLTGSVYHTAKTSNAYLYAGDRAGSRYYDLMTTEDGAGDGFRAARINPNLSNELTTFMINPFVKYKGLEFFGMYERASGKTRAESSTRAFNQYAGELIYRFGHDEKFYAGGRYNVVTGELISGEDVDIQRFNIGAGWFMTNNILAKIEYVNQEYSDYPVENIHNEAKFDGFVFEAVISF